MEQILKELNITTKKPYISDGVYVIDLDNSDEYGNIYSKLDRISGVRELPDMSKISSREEVLSYEYKNWLIMMFADFENDTYKVTLKEEIEGEEAE